MKLGMSDTTATRYRVTEHILNMCINYANYVKGAHKHSGTFSAGFPRVLISPENMKKEKSGPENC